MCSTSCVRLLSQQREQQAGDRALVPCTETNFFNSLNPDGGSPTCLQMAPASAVPGSTGTAHRGWRDVQAVPAQPPRGEGPPLGCGTPSSNQRSAWSHPCPPSPLPPLLLSDQKDSAGVDNNPLPPKQKPPCSSCTQTHSSLCPSPLRAQQQPPRSWLAGSSGLVVLWLL